PLPAPSPVTPTGVVRLVVVPSPSSPFPLKPQASTLPSDLSARLYSLPPAAMATTPLPAPSPVTPTGVVRLVVVPSPSSPALFFPQASTLPSDLRATLWPSL